MAIAILTSQTFLSGTRYKRYCANVVEMRFFMFMSPRIISQPIFSVIIGIFLISVTGCHRDSQEIVQDHPRGNAQSDELSQSQNQNDGVTNHHVVGNGGAEMMVPVMETSLRSRIDLDMDNLKYRFSFLTIRREEELKFENGRASIKISGLPTGEKGDIVFEILENNVVRLRGVDSDRTLNPGRNTSNIKMELVGAGELEVDLIIGDLGDSVPPQQQDDNPGQQDVIPPQNQDQNQDQNQENDNDRLPEEIANWDGLSDRSSGRWRIENLPVTP